MLKTDFRPQLVVRNKETGSIGVTCRDLPGPLSCDGPDEVSVVYDGTTVALGTDYRAFEIMGPENAVADLNKCGTGKGEEACIFLVVGPDGAECQRFGNLRWDLIFRTMNAKRQPEKLFPKCQLS
ncbi:MAG: hypothetical protein CO031_02100 [Candidatus Nealsonbacteria bacterium CG_4_9_14_0_2_um_filter_37_38]|uniref:Uncharacterized protein n=1 Tax=Candidatus Nealsonbacteria bacterium CG_4_10_14_0_8_um_filter_37_14 TaxID=1974684 RepID=A0A2M7R684_9BACT|nr:MAG: hypothetical protein COV63_00150 [Candidatus Nealsonbacteria bacterium CG11_big_fil_rev_8_21_14_0_20_37_68]PIY88713.1 MAG: hypothetical protein COY73_03050 [Candidatus Nealsonbacteria bacterium CG_4_10_14_0_8_um_filter_37_14]PJC51543.1 MAG: hypothetical protein CO031_02100 [Candidatus Nealsonbacteria bacterium CG_4_9_14_0_2_um_filter_37_38]